MIKPLAALAAALALAGIAACGADDAALIRDLSRDDAAVEQVAEEWWEAFGAGDGKRACALLTAEARREFRTMFRDCEQTIIDFAELLPDREAEAFGDIEVVRVYLKGDRATIKPEDLEIPGVLSVPGAERFDTTRYRRVDGTWKLDGPF